MVKGQAPIDQPLMELNVNYIPRRSTPCTVEHPCTIQLVADLDTRSKIGSGDKPLFMSKLHGGSFVFDNQNITWFTSQPFDIVGKLSEEGRGMELSELVLFGDTLLSFDDRSGIMYELVASYPEGHLRGGGVTSESPRSLFLRAAEGDDIQLGHLQITPIARAVLPEGDGEVSPKGMKVEWATEKDGHLYVGSFGKEYTTPDGQNITGTSNLWIVTVADPERGSGVDRQDWTQNYQALREATGTTFPGYMIHEAVNWSPVHRKWFFLPRRMSTESYNEQADEQRGAEKILIATEDFSNIEVVQIDFAEHIAARGFSSFKFVPGTDDDVIIALRSEENEIANTQSTYLSIFDIRGKLIMPHEIQVSPDFKYEGIEIW